MRNRSEPDLTQVLRDNSLDPDRRFSVGDSFNALKVSGWLGWRPVDLIGNALPPHSTQ
jgi:hypothetical protein